MITIHNKIISMRRQKTEGELANPGSSRIRPLTEKTRLATSSLHQTIRYKVSCSCALLPFRHLQFSVQIYTSPGPALANWAQYPTISAFSTIVYTAGLSNHCYKPAAYCSRQLLERSSVCTVSSANIIEVRKLDSDIKSTDVLNQFKSIMALHYNIICYSGLSKNNSKDGCGKMPQRNDKMMFRYSC